MKDITVKPCKSLTIKHRIAYLKYRKDEIYACCSMKGEVTLIDKEFRVMQTFNFMDELKDNVNLFDIHPVQDILYIGTEKNYCVFDFLGNLIDSNEENISAMFFSTQKNLYWQVKTIDNDTKEIRLFIENQLSNKIELQDELYSSAVHLIELPEEDKVCMFLMAGQDGMFTYFLKNSQGKIEYQYQKGFDYDLINNFSDDGKTVLAVDADSLDKYTLYAYPLLQKISEFNLPDEEDKACHQFGYTSLFLDEKHALIEMGEDLYYILNTEQMKLVARFIVKGHEPKPTSFYWPSLNDTNETTNLSVFYKTRKYLISSFKATPQSKEIDSLLFINLNEIKI